MDPKQLDYQDDTFQEVWVEIRDFPDYIVSDRGFVRNIKTGRYIKPSRTREGTLKVGLRRDGVQYARSVKVLVADAFIEGRSEIFNTPIHLDGDRNNIHADNLAWRPRWFAWKYYNQYNNIRRHYRGYPIVDVDTGDVYEDVVHAAVINGLLMTNIFDSVHNGTKVFPTWQEFSTIGDAQKR